MKILGHRVLLKMKEVQNKEKVSAGGIILATENKIQQEDSEIGIIVDIGSTAWKNVGDGEPWAKIGDVVTIQRYSGKQLTRGQDIYRVVNDEDIITLEDGEKNE